MGNKLNLFEHSEFGKIRVEKSGADFLFCAKDVCAALRLENNRQAVSRLKDDEKGVIICDTLGGHQRLSAVNESGLYCLIFQSWKPAARVFRRWVTSEVLPSLRRTGSCEVDSFPVGRRKLLWLIGEYLQHGDINDIALQLGVSRQSVSYVLSGKQRSHRIMHALYMCAQENRAAGLVNYYLNAKDMYSKLL